MLVTNYHIWKFYFHNEFWKLTPLSTGEGGALSGFVSGAFKSYLSNPNCWHNSYMIFRISFMTKNFNFFQIFLFLSSFWKTLTNKKIFLHFSPKNNLLLYTRMATCPFDPPKCFLEAYSTRCPQNAPWCPSD